MARLFLLFTIVPVVELFLLIQIGRRIGAVPTVALVLLTGLVGAALARREGLATLARWRSALSQGRIPEEGLVGGALVLVGGVLLVTPGVITDVVGLALLFGPTRRRIAPLVRRWVAARMADGTVRVIRPPARGTTVDAEGGTVEERGPHDELPR